MKEKGDPIDDQYEPSGADESGPLLPGPLYSVLPETAVPVADLRELEEHEDIVHVLPLLSIETGFGAVCERFAIQFEETGYVLENFPARMADRRGGRRRKQDRRSLAALERFHIAIYSLLCLGTSYCERCLFRVSPTDTRITNTIIRLSDRRYLMRSARLELPQNTARGLRDHRE